MPHNFGLRKSIGSWPLAVSVCIGLLVLRSWFFVAWEESYFNSDQAIVGLMAKHLSERRAWPLFFYGQEYMLAVEAWVAAPVIGLLGSSVASLRIALILLNLATGLLLLRLLTTEAKLDVWSAALASSPFWIAPVVTAASLVEAQGGNIEPFLWVLILYALRAHPLSLGLCLGIGFLNREFTMYAAPPLMIVQIIEARGISRDLVRTWIMTAVGFLVVFNLVLLLKPLADLQGPGSAGLPLVSGGRDSVSLLLAKMYLDPSALAPQLAAMVTDYFPLLVGLEQFRPRNVAIQSDVVVGWSILQPLIAGLAIVSIVLLLGDLVRRGLPVDRRWLFPAYLIAVGVIAAVAYPMARQLSLATLRYGLLVLYVPVGIGALLLQGERAVAIRLLGATVLATLAACAAIDHVRVLAEARNNPPIPQMRTLADRLMADGTTSARADYWGAYIVTFLSDEAVKVASSDFERIVEYEVLADDQHATGARSGLVTLERTACTRGEKVAGWYLCRAP